MRKHYCFVLAGIFLIVLAVSSCAFGAEDLPVSYDLRDYGRVSPVRNQGAFGTCWAFSVTAAMESNYITKYLSDDASISYARTFLGGPESIDLSELHMAWYIRRDPDRRWRDTEVKPREISLQTLSGASEQKSLAYLSRLDGPVKETSLPYITKEVLASIGYSKEVPTLWDDLKEYPSYEFFQKASQEAVNQKFLPELNTPPESYDVVLRLTDALFAAEVPYYFGKNESIRMRPKIDALKKHIMKYGAISISYNTDSNYYNLSRDLHLASYYYDNKKANHEVVVVGWDDDYPVEAFLPKSRPTQKGAWLVKNSWGTEWGNDGYFWMSYEQIIEEGTALIVEDMPAGLRVYQHDPIGWCDGYGETNTMYAANTFKVLTEGESLEGISFYTTEAGATVEWQVFNNLGDNRPELAPYVAGAVSVSGSETFEYAGYHTVKMTQNVPLTQGTYFSVVLKVTNPSEKYPVLVERKMEDRSDFAAVHDQESWFSLDGTEWVDGAYTLAGKKHVPMNACIKAFTVGGNPFTIISDDAKTIIGKPLEKYMAATSVQKVSYDSSDKLYPNERIPDEPLAERMIYVPEAMSWDHFADGTTIQFYLVNTTELHEFIDSYASFDTKYPTGYVPYDNTREYDPLFDEGYEPDVFWEADDGLEAPVYGPFVAVTGSGSYVSLDVQNLVYSDDGTPGAIPKGYYEFVYFSTESKKNFVGSIELRLAATNLAVTPDTPDTPDSPDNPVTPVNPVNPNNPVTPVTPDTPSGNNTIASLIPIVSTTARNALNRPNAKVAELPATSQGSARTVDSLSENQLADIANDKREVAVVLPEMEVDEAGIYFVRVDLSGVKAGTNIFLDITQRIVNAESIGASEDYSGSYTFFDDAGNEVHTVPLNGHVNLAMYLESGYVYSPAVTTGTSTTSTTRGTSSSSGGCDAGMSLAGLVMLAALAMKKR